MGLFQCMDMYDISYDIRSTTVCIVRREPERASGRWGFPLSTRVGICASVGRNQEG